MLEEYTCIICPNGCHISADVIDNNIISIDGEKCKRGYEYVEQELTDPQRNIASSVLLVDGELPLVSVRLTNPIPKNMIFEVMKEIKKISVKAPTKIGQIIIKDVLGLKSDVIITKEININTN